MKGLDYTALVLTIIGAINWGLVGLFKFDLVAFRQSVLVFPTCIHSGRLKRSVSLYLFQPSRRQQRVTCRQTTKEGHRHGNPLLICYSFTRQ